MPWIDQLLSAQRGGLASAPLMAPLILTVGTPQWRRISQTLLPTSASPDGGVADRLDRIDFAIPDSADEAPARADWLPVKMYFTGAALRDSAAEFRSCEADKVA